jgi:hypothetical protein
VKESLRRKAQSHKHDSREAGFEKLAKQSTQVPEQNQMSEMAILQQLSP